MDYTIHRTIEENGKGIRQPIWYVADPTGAVKRLAGLKKISPFVSTLTKGEEVRVTSANIDAFLVDLDNRGLKVEYAPWHSLGIAKGLEPEKIASEVATSTIEFKPLHISVEMRPLKDLLAKRNALLQFYGDAVRRLKQIGRDNGAANADEYEATVGDDLKILDKLFEAVATEDKGKTVSFDKQISKLASTLPECIIFNQIAGISTSSWITAASVATIIGDINRFPNVAALWHYFGQHVAEDGKAPKMTKGQPISWSPEGRKVLYQLGDSIIKNVNNPWRKFFDTAKAEELAVHLEKHPGCEHIQGHSNARARRKMVKEIMKRYFLAMTNEQFVKDHKSTPAQLPPETPV
jgi:hypothetical protein